MAQPLLNSILSLASVFSEFSSVGGAQLVATLKQLPKGFIAAEPEPIALDWSVTALVIIDMQRDFMEPGGFGETLGNDVSRLATAVKPIASVLKAAKAIRLTCRTLRPQRSSVARQACASAIPARWDGS
jgi:hypothetical protein